MAIAFVNDALTQNADATSHEINVGTPDEGDFLLMVAVADSGAGTGLNAPVGWTADIENEPGVTTGSSDCRFMVCHKFAGASEGNPSITLSASQEVAASVSRWTGVDTGTPIDVALAKANGASYAEGRIAPSITTLTDGAVWVAGCANDDDREFRGGAASLTLLRSAASNDASTGNGVGLHLRYSTIASAGETGTADFTLGTPEECEAFSIALRPAVDGESSATVTPTTGALALAGQNALVNDFATITLRGTLINEAGSPLADLTDINCLVWYNTAPAGAPDESLSSLTTNSNGSYSFALAIGGLSFGQQVYRVIYKEDPPTANNCRVHSPDYES